MDKGQDSWSSESDNTYLKLKRKETWVLISSIQNITYIHTSIRNIYCHKDDELDSNSDDLQVESNLENIVDVNLGTRGKDTLQFKLMAINSILGKIDEKSITEIKEETKEEDKEINDSHHLRSDEDPFNLQSRNLRDKLTCDQIKFLRYWINKNELSIKQLSQIYWVSPSALYTIKNKKFNDVLKGPARMLTKIPISEKRALVCEIKDTIENIDNSFNAVEITKLINENLQSNYRCSWIRNLMKTDLNLSLKEYNHDPIVST